jgi:hypothetical protein
MAVRGTKHTLLHSRDHRIADNLEYTAALMTQMRFFLFCVLPPSLSFYTTRVVPAFSPPKTRVRMCDAGVFLMFPPRIHATFLQLSLHPIPSLLRSYVLFAFFPCFILRPPISNFRRALKLPHFRRALTVYTTSPKCSPPQGRCARRRSHLYESGRSSESRDGDGLVLSPHAYGWIGLSQNNTEYRGRSSRGLGYDYVGVSKCPRFRLATRER